MVDLRVTFCSLILRKWELQVRELDVRVGVDKTFKFYCSFYYTNASYVLKINGQSYCNQMLCLNYLCSWCAIDRKISLYQSCLCHSTMETLKCVDVILLGLCYDFLKRFIIIMPLMQRLYLVTSFFFFWENTYSIFNVVW